MCAGSWTPQQDRPRTAHSGNLPEIPPHPGILPFHSPVPLKYVLGLLSKSTTCASNLVLGSIPGETQPRTGKKGVAVKILGWFFFLW